MSSEEIFDRLQWRDVIMSKDLWLLERKLQGKYTTTKKDRLGLLSLQWENEDYDASFVKW